MERSKQIAVIQIREQGESNGTICEHGKANSEGNLCICRFVTCYVSHCYEVNADFYSPQNSVSDSTKIIFF